MEKFKLCGSTDRTSEIIVDYKKKKIDIVNVPEEKKRSRIVSFFIFLLKETNFIFISGLFCLVNVFYFLKLDKLYITFWIISLLLSYFFIMLILSFFLVKTKKDMAFRKAVIYKTSKGEKNSLLISNFRVKEFILYKFRNIYLDFEAEGEVNKYLYKIWIRKDPFEEFIKHQADIEYIALKKKTILFGKWNAHFYFDKIPKNGTLFIRWI